MSEPQWDGRRGDKQCPHGYTKRAACHECRDEDANKAESDLDAALAEIERLRAALELVESEIHRPISAANMAQEMWHHAKKALGEPKP